MGVDVAKGGLRMYEVYESKLGEDDVLLMNGLTKEKAEKLVKENPKARTAIPSIINS